MADNRIRVLIDVVKDNASRSLASLKTDFANADGAAEKFKVGASGAMDFVKANAAGFAVAAGASLISFGAQAVKAFQDTALEAGKFSEATGLSVQDASRWIEVGGDLGVGADAIEGAIGRMNLAIGQGKLKEFEGDIVRAKDGTVDANATFQNLVTKIGAIEDPTKRALAAQEAFGKGYKEIAEIMELDADDLKAALEGVSDAKVVDQGELEKAREFRARLDQLKDASEDLSIALGEVLVPALIELSETAADVLGPLEDVFESAKKGDAGGLFGALSDIGDAAFDLISPVRQAQSVVEDAGESADSAAEQFLALGDESKNSSVDLYRARDAAVDADEAIGDMGDEAKTAAGYFDDLKEKYRGLKAEIDDEQAWHDLEGTMRDLKTSAEEAYVAGVEGADDAGEAAFRYEGKVIDAKEEIVNLMTELDNIPPNIESEIVAAVEKGDLERAYGLLMGIKAEDGKTYNTYTVNTITSRVDPGSKAPWPGGWDGNPRTPYPRASGGPVAPGNLYEVGEGGRPEMYEAGGRTYLIPGNQGGMVTPISAAGGAGGGGGGGGARSGGGMTVNVNISALDASGFSPAMIQRLTNEIERAQQRTGRVWTRQTG